MIEKKINQAIRLLQAYNRWKPLTLAYSGGKDSDTILHLCKLAHVPVTAVHNCTTIDPPGTLRHCEQNHVIIQRPKYTFFHLVEKKGLPSLTRRFCCEYLKEQYIADLLILGVRKDESIKRNQRYTEPAACRIYTKSKSTEQVLPILYWDIEDIKLFHDMENLHFHELYYENNVLIPTRRLGCIGCPLQGDRGKKDFINYPKFLRRLAIAYSHYVSTHKCMEGVYEDILWNIMYSNHKDHNYQQTFHGLFAPPSAKEMLESIFNIELPDIETPRKIAVQ